MNTTTNVSFAVEPVGALDDLGREWSLLAKSAQPSFFLTWAWIGTMLQTLPPTVRPLLLRGTSDGRTVALGILSDRDARRHTVVRARQWTLNATGDPDSDRVYIEHNGLLAEPAVGWSGLMKAFASAAEVDELILPGVADPPAAAALDSAGMLHSTESIPSFAVGLSDLASSRGDIAAILSSNARSQLRRAMRRLEPLSLEVAADTDEAHDYFSTLKDLHIPWFVRRGKVHAFVDPCFERFHRRLIERSFADEGVELLQVRSGERILGVLYNFRSDARVYAYQSGFVEPEDKERPGVIAHALAIRRAWEQGAEVYDFMAGENRLKTSFSNRTESLSWTTIQKPRLRFRAESVARRLRNRYRGASSDLPE
ncbi:GNAT family N-acetyltransferase [Mycobacterium sp. ITM-2016-00317]|uniref:GNAT family N-acetyltransferase n=1 Tax=Mycobacterium sp. ITM-2016-00317 TaxID=2099694 RepID=UPI00287F822D|nr:GNAT family N-acetyltransferase [Mycobacterium sp. ITM-2016-00317]WNG86961.1 GNAT family N-acetyltransferase [Mycobacterium sp. ITM-2016-00317]